MHLKHLHENAIFYIFLTHIITNISSSLENKPQSQENYPSNTNDKMLAEEYKFYFDKLKDFTTTEDDSDNSESSCLSKKDNSKDNLENSCGNKNEKDLFVDEYAYEKQFFGEDDDPENEESSDSNGNTDPKVDEEDSDALSNEFNFRLDDEEYQRVNYAMDTNQLHRLTVSEEMLYKILKEYYDQKVKQNSVVNLTLIQSYLEDFESSSKQATSHIPILVDKATVISTNPILMFRILNRLAGDYKQIKEEFEKDRNKNSKILTKLKTFEELAESIPDQKDVDDARQGIIRIHHVYEINIDQFVQGEIIGFKTNATLRAVDCLNIGNFSLDTRRIALAIEWLEKSRKLASIENLDETKKKEINKYIVAVHVLHDTLWTELQQTEQKYRLHLFHNKLSDRSRPRIKESKILRSKLAGVRTQESSYLEIFDSCMGKNYQTKEEISKLKCWLETQKHPYWLINPLKIEMLSLNPDLIQIHEFIGNNMISRILQESSSSLKRSGVTDQRKLQSKYSSERTSINAWLYDHTSEFNSFLIPLQKRIEFATDLNVIGITTSQALQVVDYSSLGAHFDIHPDAFGPGVLTENTGDRIATFMLYLNYVRVGGATAFPMMGTSAKPLKGSAVLWYNLHKNGTVDGRTWHSGCPTVLGRKLIANKWILSNDNMFKRKCTLNQND